MKTFAVIGNYKVQDAGLHSGPFPEGTISHYQISDSSIIKRGKPFFVPDFAQRFVACPVIAVRIDRLGKSIGERFATRYYNEVAPALAAVASDLLLSLMEKGLPWAQAVDFDSSLMLGDFIPVGDFLESGGRVSFSNGEVDSIWDITSLTESIDALVAKLSREHTMKTGDLILAGLSPNVLQLTQGMTLTAHVNDSELLTHRVR